ncbi:chitinase-3-like protein 1 [Argonauta hians]
MMSVLRLLIVFVVAMTTNCQQETEDSFRRWCFYTNWSQYRFREGKFLPQNIDPMLCTHISYAFANINNNELAAFEWNDEDSMWSQGMYSKVNQLKSKNPSLKTLLAVGGWKMGSTGFSQVVSNKYRRSHFISKAIPFLRNHGFNGLDVCWLYPTERGSPKEDKTNFGYFLQELKEAFKKEAAETKNEELLLAIVASPNTTMIHKAYDIDAINKYVDFVSISTYNYYNPQLGSYVMHPSALYPGYRALGFDLGRNVNSSMEYWSSLGVSKKKMNVGIPFFGRSFRVLKPTPNYNITDGLICIGEGISGIYTRLNGFLAYYETCSIVEDGSESIFMEFKGVPFTVIDDSWIGYENVRSVELKTEYARVNNYGGVMAWSLDLDDFNGICSGGEKYPLLKAIYRAATTPYNSTETDEALME